MNTERSPSGRLAADTALISGLTLASRVLGYVRDLCFATLLGAGPWADAFFVAFRTPNLVRRLFSEGTMNLALVPRLAYLRERHDEERAAALIRSTTAWTLCLLGGACLLVLLFPGFFVKLLAPGFRQEPEQWAATVKLVRICTPYALFVLLASICMAMLNSTRRFLAPALAPVILNITLIAVALAAWWFAPMTGRAPLVALALAWGVTLAGGLQLLSQLPFLHGSGFRWHGNWRWRDPEIRRLGLAIAPTIFGASLFQITTLGTTLAATWLAPGSVSWLYFSDRLVQFPLGVFAVAVSTAALPELARHSAEAHRESFDRLFNDALGLTLVLSLPAAAGFAALAPAIVKLLFGHGAYTTADVRATADALRAFSLGLPAFALLKPLVAAAHARNASKSTVWSAALGLLLFLACAPWLMHCMGHAGLALDVSLACGVNALCLLAAFRKHLPPVRKNRLHCLLAPPLLSLLIYLLALHLPQAFPDHRTTLSLALIPVLAAGYLLCCHSLGLLRLGEK